MSDEITFGTGCPVCEESVVVSVDAESENDVLDELDEKMVGHLKEQHGWKSLVLYLIENKVKAWKNI